MESKASIAVIGHGLPSGVRKLGEFIMHTLRRRDMDPLDPSMVYPDKFNYELTEAIYLEINPTTDKVSYNKIVMKYNNHKPPRMTATLEVIDDDIDMDLLSDYIPESVDTYIVDALLDFDAKLVKEPESKVWGIDRLNALMSTTKLMKFVDWVIKETDSVIHVPKSKSLSYRLTNENRGMDTFVFWLRNLHKDRVKFHSLPYTANDGTREYGNRELVELLSSILNNAPRYMSDDMIISYLEDTNIYSVNISSTERDYDVFIKDLHYTQHMSIHHALSTVPVSIMNNVPTNAKNFLDTVFPSPMRRFMMMFTKYFDEVMLKINSDTVHMKGE